MIWYHRAADIGYAPAQYNLGRATYNGDGTPLDRELAATWCRRAADQGYANAQFTLGWMYDDDAGVPPDYREAVMWYTRAAGQGHQTDTELHSWGAAHGPLWDALRKKGRQVRVIGIGVENATVDRTARVLEAWAAAGGPRDTR